MNVVRTGTMYIIILYIFFSSHNFHRNHVLGISSGIEETGGIKVSLALSLFAAWFIVFLCLCKGVQSSGKVCLSFMKICIFL